MEAYEGASDPGSHAYRGQTPRNTTMFGPAGRLYCYRIYGMHTCANVVCGPVGTATAVLVRAGEVVAGEELARQRRGEVAHAALARGPANLARALGLEVTHDGFDLEGALELDDDTPGPLKILAGPRVGLRRAADRPWRFWLAGEASVSTYRPAAPLKARTPL